MSLGQIKDYTPNFNLIIPRFDIATWHNYMESNFRSIDALFFNMFGINQYRGEWQNSTTYQVGDVLFIGDPDSQYTGRLVKVLVSHTTTANDSFDVYYSHNPINYDLFMDAAAAEQAAKLARDWAIKTDGKVQGLDYSSKYYANLITPISTEIVNVSNISNEIVNVSSISSNITSVDANSTNINTVAGMKPDVDDVVAIKSDIEWIADNDFIVTNVSNNSAKITTVANNINSVNINADNIVAIQNASANAQLARDWAIKMNGLVNDEDYSAKYWAEQARQAAGVVVDDISINRNTDGELQTIGVINQNSTTTAIKTWTGTLAQYNAIATKDSNTLYNITDDMQASTYEAYSKNETDTLIANNTSNLLATLYPVGSIYIGTQSTCPLETLISGSSWVKVGTSLVTDISIPSTLTVCGNGKTLGLTNGSTWYGVSFGTNSSWAVRLSTWQSGGATVGASVSETSTTVNKALGVIDGVQSGLIAKTDSITYTKLTVSVWQRTA